MSAAVRIRVLFFGMVRDIVGRKEDSLEVPDGGRLTWVFDHYAALFPRLKELSASIVLALNQEFAAPSNALSQGDEVAFLPPVSGGAGEGNKKEAHENHTRASQADRGAHSPIEADGGRLKQGRVGHHHADDAQAAEGGDQDVGHPDHRQPRIAALNGGLQKEQFADKPRNRR